jgi:type IV secretory pathway VirB2 component (pilin)
MRVTSFARQIVRRPAAPLAGLSLALLSASAHAQATAANFDSLRTFLQAFANFMTGPFGKVFAPKDGIFGPVLRVVVAGIAIMNAALWIAQFGGAGNITL